MTDKEWKGTWNKDGTGGWHTKTEFLTKSPDVALVEVKEKLYDRLREVRRIQKDFLIQSRQDPIWEGIVGQCGKEEYFLVELLALIERS
jgi:hypothetical protein